MNESSLAGRHGGGSAPDLHGIPYEVLSDT